MAVEVVVPAGGRESLILLRWLQTCYPLVLVEGTQPLLNDVEASAAMAAVHMVEDIVVAYAGAVGSSWASCLFDKKS